MEMKSLLSKRLFKKYIRKKRKKERKKIIIKKLKLEPETWKLLQRIRNFLHIELKIKKIGKIIKIIKY